MLKSINFLTSIASGSVLSIVWSVNLAASANPQMARAKTVDPPDFQQVQKPKDPPNRTPSSTTTPRDRLQTFLQADRLYRQGDTASAAQLYRQVKPEFEVTVREIAEPIYEAEALPPEVLTQWTTASDADDTEAIPMLQSLLETHPEFIPAHLRLAELLQDEDRPEEALAVLEQAATLYPEEADVVMAHVKALKKEDRKIEASIAAREFSALYPDHPLAPEFEKLADDYLDDFIDGKKTELGIKAGLGGLINTILGGETGDAALSTGVQILSLIFDGESAIGSQLAEEYKQQYSLVEDPEVLDYVTQIGLSVANLMGRDFDYEFYVVQDLSVNAFALPGGKVFVHTGAILVSNSEAELAGVLAHEIAHSVLSHGFEQIFTNKILAQVGDQVPLGDIAANLASLSFSREQERQADRLGTRALTTAGYAADGLRNFFVTLKTFEQERQKPTILGVELNLNGLLDTHPLTDDRIRDLETLIVQNGYNRYALEGVDRHSEIKGRLR